LVAKIPNFMPAWDWIRHAALECRLDPVKADAVTAAADE
jgi:hypothetical protein